ncbi:MAG: helix-turn-helix transcriptional regulator [Ruminococcus sp.]|nr:helix-turn-helix transcriptional regulator [Ruminococcus sp.]
MSAIGQQIKKYRLSKSYTQETLGNMIGVTTQAVSKWERGSTPDAEILPLIADALGVSIDVLYGREDQDVKLILTKKLSNLPPDEAFRYAFGICWSFIMGLTGDEEFSKEFIDMLPGQSDAGKEIVPDYFAKLIRDDGMALARTSGDFGHFFLMTEPRDKSILSLMENMEALRSVFALFADRDLLKTVCYLLTKARIRRRSPRSPVLSGRAKSRSRIMSASTTLRETLGLQSLQILHAKVQPIFIQCRFICHAEFVFQNLAVILNSITSSNPIIISLLDRLFKCVKSF